MSKLIKWTEETRKRDIKLINKIDISEKDDRQMFFYLEGRISAFSDILLNNYYEKGEK